MSINLVQWEGSTVTPKLDAIMYDDGSYGIIKGCAITHQGTNLLKIANGFIKIAGRLIEIAEETIQCQVSASGTVNGQLWIRLDLSSVTPAVFMTEAAAVLTPLTQNEDCNFENGIYELQLATYNIDESVITNLVETAPELEKLRTALDNIDLSANKVTYDNTHSGMTATKVQGAIDEINDNLAQTPITVGGETLSTIDDKLNYLVKKSGGLFSMQLGGGASVITRLNLTNNGISIPTHTTKDDANSKDIFTIQGFSELSYIWTVPYSDRPIYLYVDDVLVDQLTTVASNISRSYTLADTGLHTVEFRTRSGYASYSCDFLY